MNAFKSAAISVAAALLCAPAFAQISTNVSVGVTLNSKCEFTTGAGGLTFTGSYDAFRTTDLVTADQTLSIKCTRGVTPTYQWNGGTVGTLTSLGVVGGLTYELTATPGSTTGGTAPVVNAAGTAITTAGTADTKDIAIKVTYPAGQAGTNGTATASARSITIAF